MFKRINSIKFPPPFSHSSHRVPPLHIIPGRLTRTVPFGHASIDTNSHRLLVTACPRRGVPSVRVRIAQVESGRVNSAACRRHASVRHCTFADCSAASHHTNQYTTVRSVHVRDFACFLHAPALSMPRLTWKPFTRVGSDFQGLHTTCERQNGPRMEARKTAS